MSQKYPPKHLKQTPQRLLLNLKKRVKKVKKKGTFFVLFGTTNGCCDGQNFWDPSEGVVATKKLDGTDIFLGRDVERSPRSLLQCRSITHVSS